MKTKRLDLINPGSTVLVKSKSMKRLQPFTVEKCHRGDKKVEGYLILTDEKVNLDGGLPTHKLNNEWIESTMDRVNDKIELLTNVNTILESFKKVSSSVSK